MNETWHQGMLESSDRRSYGEKMQWMVTTFAELGQAYIAMLCAKDCNVDEAMDINNLMSKQVCDKSQRVVVPGSCSSVSKVPDDEKEETSTSTMANTQDVSLSRQVAANVGALLLLVLAFMS
mmetsp:Transcript_84483/g.154869  ORF Transcript_84483/g.154869 Transcript_84483/m.154869 type:complete len:122 (+) Transcript_84483:301-666(+)